MILERQLVPDYNGPECLTQECGLPSSQCPSIFSTEILQRTVQGSGTAHYWCRFSLQLHDRSYKFMCISCILIYCLHWGHHILKLLACCVLMLSHFSCVCLFGTLWTVAHRVPLSMGFSRQEYWNGFPFPSLGDLPNPGIESTSFMSPALAGRFFITKVPGKPNHLTYLLWNLYADQ